MSSRKEKCRPFDSMSESICLSAGKVSGSEAQFNRERNKVIHPIKRQKTVNPDGSTSFCLSLKPEAVVPHSATKKDADRYFRCFCRIVDLSGGESPRHNEEVSRARPSISDMLQQTQENWEQD